MKEKKRNTSKYIVVAASTAVVVSSFGTVGSVWAAPADETSSVKKDVSSQTQVSKFTMYGNLESLGKYNNAFKVDTSKISVKNNGGAYNGSSQLSNIFDGNLNTYWETKTPNKSNFTNDITFTFDEITELNRVIYAPRLTGVAGRGFPLEFEIQGRTSVDAEFKVVAEGRYSSNVRDAIEIQFESTEFKELKFVFKNAHDGGWAAASEFMFYKEDTVSTEVSDLFTNGLMNELKPQYKLMDKIEQLEAEVAKHPLRTSLQENIDSAKVVLNQQVDNTAVITTSQRGDANAMARKYQIARTSFSLDTFGKYVVPGETIQVFVDADKNGVMPTLVFGQIADDRNGWHRKYTLKPGLNTIIAPAYSNMKPAAIYIENGALPTQQAYAPKVRLVGGTKFPVYYHGKTDPAEFEKELEAYVAKISVNDGDFANGKPVDGKVYNIAELVSENNTISTSAAGALKGVQEMKSIGKTVKDTMDEWETMWNEFQKLSGNFKVEKDPTKFFTAKFTSRVFTKGPYGWSDWGYTGYNGGNSERRDGGFFKQIVKPFSAPGNDGWAYYHEWGHNINNSAMEHVEITNNLYSVVMRKVFENSNADRVDWNSLYKRFLGESVKQGYWTSLGILQQVQYYYGQDTYGKATQLSIQNPDGILNGLNRQQRMVVAFSLVTETDLTGFFNDWGYCSATEAMKEKVKDLPKPSVKLEYMNTLGRDYKGSGFSEDAKVTINSLAVNANDNTVKLTYDIDAANKGASMGYEILRNGEVVGYTTNTSFVDENIDTNENYTYQVVAYDKKLNTLNPVEVKAHQPTLSVEDHLTLKLNQEFNPLDYIKAVDHQGNNIAESVKVKSNVNVTKKGEYEIVYTVDSQGSTVTKTTKVTVASDFDYASDTQEQSAKVGWDVLGKNRATQGGKISLLRDGTSVIYDKGLAAHANSEVVYIIEGKGYDTFESYIGIDKAMKGRQSSAKFEVWVDDELKYTSGTFYSGTNRGFVKVGVKDAKKVKLVTKDAGSNGIDADHTVWADAKFVKSNSAPVIKVTDTVFDGTKAVNFADIVSASDLEDGILNVTYETDYVAGKYGEFDITFSAVDKEGATTTKATKVYIANDLTDLSSIARISSTGYIRDDLNHNYDTINLKVNGEVTEFAKGVAAHAPSTMLYDLTQLEDKKPTYFTSYVGIDHSQLDKKPSVKFKVYADNNLVLDTGAVTPEDSKFIAVNLKGVKQLRLEVDPNGINYNDHAVWADAKLHFENTDGEIAELNLTTANINKMKEAVKNALNNSDVDINDLTEVAIVKPKIPGFSGTATDKKIIDLVEKELGDSIAGKYGVYLRNPGNATIDELLENYLVISHQVNNDAPFYTYANGDITVQ